MKKHAGFSLMELMVVIAIIGVLSAIAIPNAISWRNNAQVNSAARGLYSDLQNARSTAVKENRDCTVSFDTSGRGSYTVSMAGKPDRTVNFSKYGAVSMHSADFNGASEIIFRPDGFAYTTSSTSSTVLSGGSVELNGAINLRIVLTHAGNVRIQNT